MDPGSGFDRLWLQFLGVGGGERRAREGREALERIKK